MFTDLDRITRNWLRRREYSLHWYVQALGYAVDCVKRLHEDRILQNFQTEAIEIDENGIGKLPHGVMEVIRVTDMARLPAHPLYGYSRPELIERVQFYHNDAIIPYDELQYQYFNNYLYCWNGVQQGFVVREECNEIEITSWQGGEGEVLIQFIGNGLCNNATKLNAYAEECIISYITWQYKMNNRSYNEGEARRAEQDYMMERRKLFRKMPRGQWSIESIKGVFSKYDTMGVRWGNPLIYNQ